MLKKVLKAAAFWGSFGLIMGFVVGGTFATSQFFHAPYYQHSTNHRNDSTNHGSDQKINKSIARYTKYLMISTGVLATATILLMLATLGLYVTGEKQIRLVRREFNATHRPRLLVREIETVLPPPKGILITCSMTVANIGESEATIVESNIGFDFVEKDRFVHTPKRIPNRNDLEVEGPIASGESHTFTVTSTERDWSDANTQSFVRDEIGLFAVGHITYEDAIGIRRQLAFWRKYDPEHFRFRLVGNPGPEYEYAD